MNSKIIKLIKHYEIIIACVFALFIIIILTLIYVVPNFEKASDIFTQSNQILDKKARLNQKNNQLDQLDSTQITDVNKKLNTILPGEKDYVSLFSTFDALEKQTNVSILSTEFQLGIVSTNSASLIKSKGAVSYTIPTTVSILGSFRDVQTFLQTLINLSGRLMTVNEISWKQKSETQVQVTISGNAYFYPLPATIPGVDRQLAKLTKSQEELLGKINQAQSIIPDIGSGSTVGLGKTNLFQ